MDRRHALMALGAIAVCMVGRPVPASEERSVLDFEMGRLIEPDWTDYTIREDAVRDIIIERKGKENIVVPFSEIVKALEGEDDKDN